MNKKELKNLPITIDSVDEVKEFLTNFLYFKENSQMITEDMSSEQIVDAFINYKSTENATPIDELFDDLEANAYDSAFHKYFVKEANQIIRKHFMKQEGLMNSLMHHKDTTVGLWATDRPDLIYDPKLLLFQINFTHNERT